MTKPDFMECPHCHKIIELDEAEYTKELEIMYSILDSYHDLCGMDSPAAKFQLEKINRFELEHFRR